MNGATFVARGFSGHGKHLLSLIRQAFEHKGFSFIDCFSPCVTFNKHNSYDFFRERIKKLEDEDHDPSDWKSACEKAMHWDDMIYTGLYYKNEDVPALNDQEPVLKAGPVAHANPSLTKEQGDRILKRMM